MSWSTAGDGEKSQVRWSKALEEMGPERLVKRVYEAEVEGSRGQGRPRKKWNDNFKHWHVTAADRYKEELDTYCIRTTSCRGDIVHIAGMIDWLIEPHDMAVWDSEMLAQSELHGIGYEYYQMCIVEHFGFCM